MTYEGVLSNADSRVINYNFDCTYLRVIHARYLIPGKFFLSFFVSNAAL